MKKRIVGIISVFTLLAVGYITYLDRLDPWADFKQKTKNYFNRNRQLNQLEATLKNIKNTNVDVIHEGEEFDKFVANCWMFSKALLKFSEEIMQSECHESSKTQVLQMSQDICVIAKKLPKRLIELSQPTVADTTCLTIFYEYLEIEVMAKMNSIAFDNSCNTLKRVEQKLQGIVDLLNEQNDSDIYVNTIEGIGYDCPKLMEQLHKKLVATDCYEKIKSTHKAKKLLDYIRKCINNNSVFRIAK
ncbi:MAG: hypothetical protein K6C34_01675 [Alphaproteobacteria bacterium]|nr:hypothetical protein [Alphaproteobacteria bacterium]